ncbi:MAG TPA: hypothetical protein VMJ10_27875 [Kofleriaceae bacterium]|nr:hypothetical protein [Kofleriaceae bacterium]
MIVDRIRRRTALIACALAACAPAHRSSEPGDAGGAGGILVVEPANVTITVVNGQTLTQPFTVTEVSPDGARRDVTAEATLALADPALGSITDATFTPSGTAGMTSVAASLPDGTNGSALLTVMVRGWRTEGSAPPSSAALFAAATEDPALAPTIVYPSDGILVPPNLGAFDVHWTDTSNDLFAIDLSSSFIDYTIYTTGQPGPQWWTVVTPDEWAALASASTSAQQPLALTVAGLTTSAPDHKGTSVAQHVDVTTDAMLGGVYYWTTTSPQGVYRYDMSQPNTPAAPYFMPSQDPGGANNCMGCHALSHDGTKLAITIDQAGGPGTVIDVATGDVLVPYATDPQYWDFATFNADGSKLVTAQTSGDGGMGTMVLRATAGGAVLASIPSSPNMYATEPELSPDGTMLVDVEESVLDNDIQPTTGAIVTRSFDDATNTFGPITTVLADGVGGLSSYYPSWSPDGQWLLITRAAGDAYANPESTVWVVKADGSMPPIELARADLTGSLEDSWPRWAPFAQTTSDGQPVFYFTFSSQRAFGVRIATPGTPQIWMAPFYPALAAQGLDASGPAFRPPFQPVDTHNHIAQWTQQVIVIERSAP